MKPKDGKTEAQYWTNPFDEIDALRARLAVLEAELAAKDHALQLAKQTLAEVRSGVMTEVKALEAELQTANARLDWYERGWPIERKPEKAKP